MISENSLSRLAVSSEQHSHFKELSDKFCMEKASILSNLVLLPKNDSDFDGFLKGIDNLLERLEGIRGQISKKFEDSIDGAIDSSTGLIIIAGKKEHSDGEFGESDECFFENAPMCVLCGEKLLSDISSSTASSSDLFQLYQLSLISYSPYLIPCLHNGCCQTCLVLLDNCPECGMKIEKNNTLF